MKPVQLITIFTVLALIFSGCSTSRQQQTAKPFDSPPTTVTKEDKGLYSQALAAQNKGQLDQAMKLWKTFLTQNPDSHEGHNNLGMVYYTQDMASQALEEFETAYRLQPADPRIRQNLARVLLFKADMFHENREYYETLEILARLENIVSPEDKQAVLFKQEQVEDQIYIQVMKAGSLEAYLDFIKRFPDGLNAVRAQEYLDKKDPRKVAKATLKKKKRSKKKKSKNRKTSQATQVKSWISSGKKVADPSGSADSSKFGATQPVATYTPPPAKTDQKKKVDIFGIDPSPDKNITEADLNSSKGVTETAAAIAPFEESEKPQRAEGDQAPADEPVAVTDNRAATDDADPVRGEPEVTVANSTDTEQAQVVVIPTEVDPPQSSQATADNTEMKPAEQAPAEEAVTTALTQTESAPQAQAPPEPAQETPAETPEVESNPLVIAGSEEDVESESERISRIIREEIAKEEQAQSGRATESTSEKSFATESPAEEPEMEVARLDQEKPAAPEAVVVPDAEPETVAVEEPATPEAVVVPDAEPEVEMAGNPEGTESPVAATQQAPASIQMVVIQVAEGSTLNVRAAPSATGEILGYLERGDMMPFTKVVGEWYQIEIEEELYGWVNKKFSEIRTVTAEGSAVPEPQEELPEEMASTESPVPAEPEESAAMVVIQVREGSTLNVRSEPTPQGEVVDMLVRGDQVPLIEEKDGWFHVQVSADDTGWISKKFSAIKTGTADDVPEPAPKQKIAKQKIVKQKTPKRTSKTPITTVIVIKVKQGSFLNVRSAPSSHSQVMGSLGSGDMRPLMKEKGEWYQVELPDGTTGWISSKFSGKIDVISNVIPGL